MPWDTPTAPWVTVAFRGPAFSETDKDAAAIDLFVNMNFGATSDVYRKLVEQEQKVDQFFAGGPDNVDPELIYVFARVKKAEDALYVRDEIQRAVARARAEKMDARKLDGSQVQSALLVHRAARQHRHDRRHAGALRALSPVVRHAEQRLPRLLS